MSLEFHAGDTEAELDTKSPDAFRTISEVAEPEPPFTPSGCFAQAWSVAEVLRSWQQLAD